MLIWVQLCNELDNSFFHFVFQELFYKVWVAVLRSSVFSMTPDFERKGRVILCIAMVTIATL